MSFALAATMPPPEGPFNRRGAPDRLICVMLQQSSGSAPTVRRSRLFILGYGAAQAGAYIAFIPLLTLLLPARADALAGDGREVLLGQAAMLGGFTAAAANLAFGMLSDRPGPLGRRRPWILLGVGLVLVALALIASADSPAALLGAVVIFQVAMNALYAPLSAVVPDQVPDAQKGVVSAWAGGALPVANLFTALVVTQLAPGSFASFAAVMIASATLVLPFVLRLREAPRVASATRPRVGLSLAALRDGAFRRAFVSRLLIESAIAIHTLYLLFLVQSAGPSARPDGWSTAQAFSALLILSTLAAALAGFLAGAASDRVAHRRLFVVGGGLAMAAALVGLGLSPSWAILVCAQLVFGIGHGVHAASVAAMTAEILPDHDRAGRDLGVMNMAIALPQGLAPGGAALIMALGSLLQSVFLAAGLLAALGCIVLLGRLTNRRPPPPPGVSRLQ